MTKAELVERLAQATDRSRTDAEHILDAILNVLTQALENGNSVDLRGFGRFQVSEKKERQGRNPRTGETMTIAAKRVVMFKPSKDLAGNMNRTQNPTLDDTAITG